MGGVCERPGCSRLAAAAVAADPRRGIVWLGDIETSTESINVLCAHHADNLAVPVGWERRDLRDAPRLFAVPSSATRATTSTSSADEPPRRRRSIRKGSPSMAEPLAVAPPLALTDDPAATPATPAAGGAPDAAPAGPNAPVAAAKRAKRRSAKEGLGLGELHQVAAELSPATSAMLSAGVDTPLLARAFRTARAAG